MEDQDLFNNYLTEIMERILKRRTPTKKEIRALEKQIEKFSTLQFAALLMATQNVANRFNKVVNGVKVK